LENFFCHLLKHDSEAGEPLFSGVGRWGEAEGDGFGAVPVVDGESFGLQGDEASGGLPGGESGGGFDGVVTDTQGAGVGPGGIIE